MPTPTYDSYIQPPAGTNERRLSVKVVSTLEDFAKVIAIRAATYMSEQRCPYDEEFDGNDFCGAQFLGFVGGEPAGCLRARFFAGFAKLERLAVRSEFRKTRLAFRMVRAGIDFARKKGFTTLYGHAQERLESFWSHFGARPLGRRRDLVFSDFRYTEMRLDLPPDPDAITMESDPYVIVRPEGRWHCRGVLEVSSVRPVTSPLASR